MRYEAVTGKPAIFCPLQKWPKGPQGVLLEAIRIMLKVGPAIQDEEKRQQATRKRALAAFERTGVKVSDVPK